MNSHQGLNRLQKFRRVGDAEFEEVLFLTEDRDGQFADEGEGEFHG